MDRRRVIIGAVGVAIAAAAVATAATVAGGDASNRVTPSASPTSPAAASPRGVLLPSFATSGGAVDASSGEEGAFIQGVLDGNRGCVWLVGNTGDRVSLVWPHGWRYAAKRRAVLDPDGDVWAHLGDQVTGGGGALGAGDFPSGDQCVVSRLGDVFSPS